jgi:hypothetical protein
MKLYHQSNSPSQPLSRLRDTSWRRAKATNNSINRQGGAKDRHLREQECFADLTEGDAFRCLILCSAAWKRRIGSRKSSELRLDRHDEMSAGFIGHLQGLLMSRPVIFGEAAPNNDRIGLPIRKVSSAPSSVRPPIKASPPFASPHQSPSPSAGSVSDPAPTLLDVSPLRLIDCCVT